jgi:hypothetical protein
LGYYLIPIVEVEQWGSLSGGDNWDIYYNINFINNIFVTVGWDNAAGSSSTMQFVGVNFQQTNKNHFHIYTSGGNNLGLGYIAIGF